MAARIHPTSIVDARAVIGDGCEIGPFCTVGPQVRLGERNRLVSHVVIDGRTTIGNGNTFSPGAVIGGPPQDLKYKGEDTELIVGDDGVFRECTTINRGTVGGGGKTTVGSGVLLMAYAHIAHDCHVGDGVIMANCATLAGHVTIEDYASIGGLTPVHQGARVGAYAFIGGQSRVSQDVVPYVKMGGIPVLIMGANSIGLKRRGFSDEVITAIEQCMRLLFRARLSIPNALARIRSEVPKLPEVDRIITFVETTRRGILRG